MASSLVAWLGEEGGERQEASPQLGIRLPRASGGVKVDGPTTRSGKAELCTSRPNLVGPVTL